MRSFYATSLQRRAFSGLVLLSILLFSNTLWGTTFVVSNKNDSGTGSLRQAILSANADLTATALNPHIIDATNVFGTITLLAANRFMVITNHMTIKGPGQDDLIISGGTVTRIFWIQNGTISIQNLTLANGLAQGGFGGGMGAGGAIFIHEGKNGGSGVIDLCLINVTLTNNRAQGGMGGTNIGGGGMGGNSAGGGGGVLGSGSALGGGGSITDASGVTPGANGGIAIFGSGGAPATINGGAGGFGGGGGSGENGGAGGFGGGGGIGSANGVDGIGGKGGFGGGGGFGGVWGTGGMGGFGGGAGGGGTLGGTAGFGGGGSNNEAGGGGMGAGGAIFIASGKLTLAGVIFKNNTAAKGAGATIVNNGKGLGGGLFIFKKTDNGGIAAPGTTTDPVVTTCSVGYSNNLADDDNNTASNNDNIYGTPTDATPTVNAVPNQTLSVGNNSTPVTFGGNNPLSSYPWINDETGTGLAPTGTNTVPSFVAQNGTASPLVSTITVTPEVQLSCVVCKGVAKSFTITVNAAPVQTPTVNPVSNQVVCNANPTTAITFTGSLPNTVFNWTNNTPSIGLAASGTGNIASFTALNTGGAPVVATITVTPSRTVSGNTTVGTPITFTITVNPTPNVAAISNQVVCNATPTTALNFTGNVTGTVFTWTNNTTSIGLAATGTGNIPAFNAVNTGTAPIVASIVVTPRYTNAGVTCTGPTATITITVNPTPTVAAVSSQVACDGTTTTAVNFTGTVTGTVFNWTNNTPSIGLPTSGTGNIAPFTAVNNGNAVVIATITVTPQYSNGGTTCVGTPTTFTITVNPTPSVSPVASQVVCHNASTTTVTFSGDVPGTVFNWTNNTTSIGLAATGTGNIASFSAKNTGAAPVVATITVTPQYSNGGKTCTGTPITFTITVIPAPTVAAVTNKVVCDAGNVAAISFSGTVTGTVFSWTNSNTSIGLAASGTGTIPAFTATNIGNTPEVATITVTPQITNAGVTCSGTPTTFTITVNPVPTVNAVANQTICNGEQGLGIVFTGPVTGTVYNWTNSTPSIGLAATGTGNIPAFIGINTGTAPVTATITVTPRYTNAAVICTGPAITFTITVQPTPTVNPVGNQTVCTGNLTTAINFTGNVPGTSYVWTNNTPSIGLAAAGTGNIAAFTAVNNGTAPVVALIVVTPRFMGCDGAPMAFAITVDPLPTQLVCNDLSTFVLDADCSSTVLPGDILLNALGCSQNFSVTVTGINGTPNYGNTVTAANLGQTLKVTVKNLVTNSSCFGLIKVEDATAPKVTCPAAVTVACSDPTDVSKTGTVTVMDCSTTTTVVKDVFTDLGDCGVPRARITRTWTVTDSWGNQSNCSQVITIKAFELPSVVFPPDITLNCGVVAGNPSATLPAQTGTPTLNGASILGSILCSSKVNYSDEFFNGCTGTYTIIRTWSVLNDCLPASATNPSVKAQRIKVVDDNGPAFTCPANITVSTNQSSCCANASLPPVVMSEGCSKITTVQAMVTGTNPLNGNAIQFVVPGSLADFPGNNYWNPDTLAVFGPTQCLPLGGVYTVMYVASDGCANSSTCQFTLTVQDFVAPVASCDQTTTVALGDDDPLDCYTPGNGCSGAGVVWISAKNFDDGSNDKCNNIKITVRRMEPYSACIDKLNACEKAIATAEKDSIKFYCCESGTKQRIILRVYQVDINGAIMQKADGSQLFNECMVEVEVQDKLTPLCQAPPHVTVACENFDPSLWVYGQPTIIDNCCLDTTKTYQGKCGYTHSANYAQFDTLCHRGTIVRTFKAYDCHGFSSDCTQRVVVTYNQDYYVKFPDDVVLTVCDGSGSYGAPSFFGKDCEALASSFEDTKFTLVPDACFKIERTWRIINWCTFNPNLPLKAIPNPNPDANSQSPLNLPGPTVSKCGTAGLWAPTKVKINPTDAAVTDYCTFWEKDANGYIYQQIIKVLDQQKPTVNCPTSPTQFCDQSNNLTDLWNESYWYDQKLATHDLCEGPVDLSITASDACSGANLDFQYQLFLDLDNDGTMETVVSSATLPGANTVAFGNAANPNFTGGTPRSFDERPVSPNLKYAFALQVNPASGNSKSASVRWNTLLNPTQYTVPELPYGTHKIKWIVSDGCGNQQICEYTFVVKDCKKPNVVCINGLSSNILSPSGIQLWASDFLKYAEDNCTPAAKIQFGLRRAGAGTGFPTNPDGSPQNSLMFTCNDLGQQAVELWAMDAAGNADFCATFVIIQDNSGNCSISSIVAGEVLTEKLEGVEDVSVKLVGTAGNLTISETTPSDDKGHYKFSIPLPAPLSLTVTPMKNDDPLNGVSTYDLVLISKHILGLEPLSGPYKMIAADANKSGSITTFDIVELRKLILGIYTELPGNTSWRFIDKNYTFPDPFNPFKSAFPEGKALNEPLTTVWTGNFVSIKVGDVNVSAITHLNGGNEDRSAETLWMETEDRTLSEGEVAEVTFRAAAPVQGYQMTLALNGLSVAEVLPQGQVTADNFGIFPDALTVSVGGNSSAADGSFTVRFKVLKTGKLSQMLRISSQITPAEAYGWTNDRQNVALRFLSPTGATLSRVGFELYQNQPNPFAAKTSIGFHLPQDAQATLRIFTENGQQVYFQEGDFNKGYHTISIERSQLPATGLLYYEVSTAEYHAVKKMVLMD